MYHVAGWPHAAVQVCRPHDVHNHRCLKRCVPVSVRNRLVTDYVVAQGSMLCPINSRPTVQKSKNSAVHIVTFILYAILKSIIFVS